MKMTMKTKLLGLVAASAIAFSGSAFSQDKAKNLDQLLQMMKNSKISESKEHRKREGEFRRSKTNQNNLYKQALAVKAKEERRSEKLEAKFKQQDLLVQQKRKQYEERLGSLKELFGHLTSTAGDLRANLDTSIVSAQYPGRGDFLEQLIEDMNSETKLPTIEEIERLWYELQRETVESGRVAKFTGDVSDPAGNTNPQEIVRVGNYNLVSNGKYLSYEAGRMSELIRQPSSHLGGAKNVQSAAPGGFVKVGIDPTGPQGGSLLKALVASPKLDERFKQGGVVGMYMIFPLFVIGILVAIWRFMVLVSVGGKVRAQLKPGAKANPNNPLGRVLKVAEDNKGVDVESLELKLEEAVLKERPAIEGYLGMIKIISMVAPLLGLLGTVTGMIQTFQAITVFGAGDPTAMAGGISAALVTTVKGLLVAIPTVLIHTFLNSKAKSIVHILDEQSAGLIAERVEGK